MCCRFRLECILPDGYEAILALAGFARTDKDDEPSTGWKSPTKRWRRMFPEIWGVTRSIDVIIHGAAIEFNLSPAIGSHSPWEHAAGAFPASVAVKLAVILANFAGEGTIKQTSMMGDCPARNGNNTVAVIAAIGKNPEIPPVLENMCPGFQDVLIKGIPIEVVDGQTQRMSEEYVAFPMAVSYTDYNPEYELYGGEDLNE